MKLGGETSLTQPPLSTQNTNPATATLEAGAEQAAQAAQATQATQATQKQSKRAASPAPPLHMPDIPPAPGKEETGRKRSKGKGKPSALPTLGGGNPAPPAESKGKTDLSDGGKGRSTFEATKDSALTETILEQLALSGANVIQLMGSASMDSCSR
jgi:hypothetical protein